VRARLAAARREFDEVQRREKLYGENEMGNRGSDMERNNKAIGEARGKVTAARREVGEVGKEGGNVGTNIRWQP
jgi:hypothetical protein